MKKGRDAGFSSKRSGNAGSGAPLPDPAQFSSCTGGNDPGLQLTSIDGLTL